MDIFELHFFLKLSAGRQLRSRISRRKTCPTAVEETFGQTPWLGQETGHSALLQETGHSAPVTRQRRESRNVNV